MLGKMQDWPLRMTRVLDHAEQVHGNREVITCEADGSVSRTNWKGVARDSRIFAHHLESLGMRPGDRIGTLAKNHTRHLVSWFGTMGMGGVIHTINWRLFDEQIVYIINHAEDRVLLYDDVFSDIVERIRPQLRTVEHFICFDQEFAAIMAYETGDYRWHQGDERDPAMLCYTSGTTGNPKGVLYEHRSTVLHAMMTVCPDAFDLTHNSTALSFVPMFHAASWGGPFTCAITGARLIFSIPNDMPTTHRMMIQEGVTHSAGVPTIWAAMLQYIDSNGLDLGKLRHISVGGSAASRALIGRFLDMGIHFQHLWGMTEISPVGTVCGYPDDWDELDRDARIDYIQMQGIASFGAELRIIDDTSHALPHDGKTPGELQIRGAWVVDTYFKGDRTALDADGWFSTGDIAVIHPNGYMQITDRAKDVIKSGGEWISSIDLENAATGCPGVVMAAAVGVPHPKWEERPILLVVRAPAADVSETAIRDHLARHVARWWLPEEILFVDALPLTGTGKIMKTELREKYKTYKPAGRAAAE
jgi:fatty-acyl-CoA synthase